MPIFPMFLIAWWYRSGQGSVITISSVATIGVHAEMALFGYSQAKAALEHWTKAIVCPARY